MSDFDTRLSDLIGKLGARAEGQGIEWRLADREVFAFRAGGYVVTVARDHDPVIAIYGEDGREMEAIDRADLDGRALADGRPMEDAKNRIWRLARRGSGVSAPAVDAVMAWLDGGAQDGVAEPAPQPAVPEPFSPEPYAPDAWRGDGAELAPQAPQAGMGAPSGQVETFPQPPGGDAGQGWQNAPTPGNAGPTPQPDAPAGPFGMQPNPPLQSQTGEWGGGGDQGQPQSPEQNSEDQGEGGQPHWANGADPNAPWSQ